MMKRKVKWVVPLLVVMGMLYMIGLISVHLNQRARIFLPSKSRDWIPLVPS